MTAKVTALYRYPLKGFGAEALERVALTPGEHVPHDRTWALAHAGSDWDPERREWVKRKNFVQTAMTPELAQVATHFSDGQLTLTAPDREPLSADPETEGDLIAAWAEGIAGHRQPGPYRLARLAGTGTGSAFTDVADAHVSLMSDASLRALSERAGRTVERRRFRGNIWLDGLAPWEEFDLVDREVSIGPVRLRVTARIDRCAATTASPETGSRDTPMLDILREAYGHIDFGVYAQVVSGGEVASGDPVVV